jgi:hypothetical protein
MQRFAIFQCNDTQILAKFPNVPPVSDSTIRLNFGAFRVTHGLFTPFQLNIRPLSQHAILEIGRLLDEN